MEKVHFWGLSFSAFVCCNLFHQCQQFKNDTEHWDQGIPYIVILSLISIEWYSSVWHSMVHFELVPLDLACISTADHTLT